METVPNFICPTCGYFGATTWEQSGADDLSAERVAFGCRELLGMILIDHVKGYAFQLACLHPDGTYGYAPESEPGKRADVDKGRLESRVLTAEEVETVLSVMPPLRAGRVPDAMLEQKIYRTLAGLLYATYDPLNRAHLLLNFREHFVEEGGHLADWLYGLSDASPLARHYDVNPDGNFTALQEEVLRLVQPHYWVVSDAGLADELEYGDHVLTPAVIREALTPRESDAASDAEEDDA